MSTDTVTAGRARLTTIALVVVMAVAVIGYVVGLSDGVPRPSGLQSNAPTDVLTEVDRGTNDKVIDAVRYAQIPETAMGPTLAFQTQLASLPTQSDYDLYAKVVPSPEEKAESSKIRGSRRAYNGAPPIIPHAVQNTNDSACYACHSGGLKIDGMKASVMSHPYLANCTQCHAPPPPAPFQDADISVQNSFVGLPAPKAGKRAYPGAPPTIPHSQWMRESCHACHGGPNGWAGMESTHPYCAHPSHFREAISGIPRIRGLRANASSCSHEELDNSEVLDDGDSVELGGEFAELLRDHPQLTVVGGCCGTDHRHIEQIGLAVREAA